MTDQKQLILDSNFNGDISFILKYVDLEYLSFGYMFDGDISLLKELKKLKVVKFGEKFNQSINTLAELPELERVEFGYSFDKSIDSLAKLPKLWFLRLSRNFNQKFPESGFESLTELYIGSFFNQELGCLKYMKNLKKLTIGMGFKHELTELKYTKNLEKLNLESYDNGYDIDFTQLPKLRELRVNNCKNKILDLSKNTELRELCLDITEDRKLDLSNNKKIAILTFGPYYKFELPDISGLPELGYMCVYDSDVNFSKLPKSLEYLRIPESAKSKIPDYILKTVKISYM